MAAVSSLQFLRPMVGMVQARLVIASSISRRLISSPVSDAVMTGEDKSLNRLSRTESIVSVMSLELPVSAVAMQRFGWGVAYDGSVATLFHLYDRI